MIKMFHYYKFNIQPTNQGYTSYLVFREYASMKLACDYIYLIGV